VKLLERRLGVPPFERLRRGVRLSESDKSYLPSVRKALEEILASTLGIFGPTVGGSVTVRAPTGFVMATPSRDTG